MSLSQCYGHSRVLGILIPKTLVIWASPVTPTLTSIQIAKVTWEGDAHISRVLGMRMPISLWHRHFRNGIELTFAKTSGTVTRETGSKHWPIADRCVPSSDPRNNCGTHFVSSSLLVSKVANHKQMIWMKHMIKKLGYPHHANFCKIQNTLCQFFLFQWRWQQSVS